MGQRLINDNIARLTQSLGVLTLAAGSVLTIGGQQYSSIPAINRSVTADGALSANTTYIVYAVVSGGSVDLRISPNMNSVGPSGFSSWAIVGAFFTNGSSTFGVFSDTVFGCSYENNAGTGLTASNGAVTLLPFNVKTYDDANAYVSSQFVCPCTTEYTIGGHVSVAFTTGFNANSHAYIGVWKNGVNYSLGVGHQYTTSWGNASPSYSVSSTVQCNAGDVLDLRFYIVDNFAGGTATLTTPAERNRLNVSASSPTLASLAKL